MRTVTWNKRFSHVTHFVQKTIFLKLNDIYKFELAKFMHELFNDKLSQIFQSRFVKTAHCTGSLA